MQDKLSDTQLVTEHLAVLLQCRNTEIGPT